MARKILLADDSVTAQNMGRKILADAGYEVVTVNNGSAALKKISEQHPDVIVLDVYMPGYSGLEVCQRLKEVGETSRIPILLTVGKLEPFKPEEAKRVRADAFIVKPFEASELLSALTKLEDKIVHHAESSKPGRFGRAAAAMDERFDRTVAIDEDDGWKSRLSFPPKKKEETKKEEAGEAKPQPAAPQAPPPSSAAKGEEPKIDLGALAPPGLPKDVTPEEIAALAAAAARMKGKLDTPPVSEMAVVPPATLAESKPEAPTGADSTPTPQSMAGPGPIYAPKAKVETKEPESSKDSIAAQIPAEEPKSEEKSAPEAVSESKPPEIPAEMPSPGSAAADEPVTMAASPVAEPLPARWTAVAVTLAPEDSVSLEQEMQKAFAASAGAEDTPTISNSAALVADATPAAAPEPEAPASISATASSEPESKEPESSQTIAGAAVDLVSAAVNELESMASSYAAQSPSMAPVAPETPAAASKTAEPSASEATKVLETMAESGSAKLSEAPVAVTEEVVLKPEAAVEAGSGLAAPQIPTGSESRAAEPVAQSSGETPEISQAPSAVLESSKHLQESAEATAASSKAEESKKEDAAMAAAVGSKGPVEESKSEPETDPDVASIVDSVLANLRPKIVQEISRKLGKK